jgi:hypothetical protein
MKFLDLTGVCPNDDDTHNHRAPRRSGRSDRLAPIGE